MLPAGTSPASWAKLVQQGRSMKNAAAPLHKRFRMVFCGMEVILRSNLKAAE
jgi:hypothetical protein